MDYQQALDYIFSYTDYEKVPMPHDPAFYDLRRVEELLARLGNPHLGARSVHIAGTNGKGSTAAMVASALTKVQPFGETICGIICLSHSEEGSCCVAMVHY